MDSFDLFKQLTRGTKLTKRKSSAENEAKENDRPKIKEEISTDNNYIEPEENIDAEQSDEETTFQLIEGNPQLQPAKKKKKVAVSEKERAKRLQDEMLATLRKDNRITVLGKNIPPPIISFEELQTNYNISQRLLENLSAYNYPQPTPIQMQSIPIMLQGRPLMACAPTGSGKTIAFLTPIINDLRAPQKVGFRAIVLAPTRELAKQIYRECVRLAEKTALRVHIISKVNQAEQKFSAIGNKKCDILISTPNRIRYLLQQEPPLIDLKCIEWIVIDEADRLMEEGQNNFKDQVDDIIAACTNTKKKLALFSATYTVPVAKWALKNLKNLARVTVGQQNSATDTVEQELLFVGSESGKLLAVRDLVRAGLKPPVLVFVQSKDRAKQLFQELLYDGINVDVIHADRTQQQRDNCVRAFREGGIWVLICTELMGRGIDFKGVNLVINYDFPPSIISYIHRIGRTGRAGRTGKAITFFTQNDTPNLRSIAHIIKNSGGKVPEFMLTMKKLRKTERKKLANAAPKRDDISTQIKHQAEHQNKLQKVEKVLEKKSKALKNNKNKVNTTKTEKKLEKVRKLKTVNKSLKQAAKAPKSKKKSKT